MAMCEKRLRSVADWRGLGRRTADENVIHNASLEHLEAVFVARSPHQQSITLGTFLQRGPDQIGHFTVSRGIEVLDAGPDFSM